MTIDRRPKGISADELIDAWKRNNYAQGATARELGCDRTNVVRRLRNTTTTPMTVGSCLPSAILLCGVQ